jgi:hypothetical protein
MENPSKNNNVSGKLHENQIETLLSQALPKPSSHFYQKMDTAPWKNRIFQEHKTHFIISKPIRNWKVGFTIIFLFLFMFGISFIPSVQAIAHQIFYSFFSSPSNQIEVQVTSSTPQDMFNFSDPDNFSQTIADAQQRAGYSVKDLYQQSESLILIGALYEPNCHSVTILYQGKDYKLFLTQRPIGNGKDIFSIGSDVQIQLVNIGDHQGEFVVGGWKVISTQTISDAVTPESQTNISAIWDIQLPQYTLRWQENGFAYELRALGAGSPSQSDLIVYAIGLK